MSKKTRVEWCKFILHKFRTGESKALSKIVPGDLVPCDFFEFPEVKKQIRGVTYSSPKAATSAYNSAILDSSQNNGKSALKSGSGE